MQSKQENDFEFLVVLSGIEGLWDSWQHAGCKHAFIGCDGQVCLPQNVYDITCNLAELDDRSTDRVLALSRFYDCLDLRALKSWESEKAYASFACWTIRRFNDKSRTVLDYIFGPRRCSAIFQILNGESQ